MLAGQGVPPTDVIADIPTVLGHTVVNSAPHVGLPGLELPPIYAPSVRRPESLSPDDIENALVTLAGQAAIAGVVWFFMDHGAKHAFFVSGAAVDCAIMEAVYRRWPQEKPLIVIADACYSTEFAQIVVGNVKTQFPELRTAWITSGKWKCLTSAIVLSDDAGLVNHDARTGLAYRISSGMLTRRFLREAAYAEADLSLNDLVAALGSGGYDGFDVDLCVAPDGVDPPSLRTLFGPPINPNAAVRMGDGSERLFKDILRPGILDDDMRDFLREFPVAGFPRGAFIKVARNEAGNVVVVDRGILADDDPVMRQITADADGTLPPPVHVLIDLIVDAAIGEIWATAGPSLARPAPNRPPAQDGPHVDLLTRFVTEVNQASAADDRELRRLSREAADVEPDALLSIVAVARQRVARKGGINLVPGASKPADGRILRRVGWFIGFLLLIVVPVSLAIWLGRH
jgi:hypothetical protein